MSTVIRIGGYQGPASVHTRAVRVLERALRDSAGDTIRLDFLTDIAATGRKVADLLTLVEVGELDMCYFSASYLSDRVPELGVYDIPFQFADRAKTQGLLKGTLGAYLAGQVGRRTRFRVLAFWDNGLRNLSNRLRPVSHPDHCVGLRIRTLPSAGYHDTFRALGMEPVTIDVRDFVNAVSDGVVDAQENPLANINQFEIYKYHSYVTLTRHFHGISLLLCNARSWTGWPDRVRQILVGATAQATEAQWRFAAEEDAASRKTLENKGVQIIDLDDEARATFWRAVRPVAERQYAQLAPDLLRLLPHTGA